MSFLTPFDPWEGSILLVLTGDIQIGKTRWLQDAIARLEKAGVVVEGVVAPGVWRPVGQDVLPGETLPVLACDAVVNPAARNPAPGMRFDKLGINNELLPSHEIVAFARREDLARAEGTFDAGSQAAQEGLTWHIDDAAIERVNRHFDELAAHIEKEQGNRPADQNGADRPHRVLVVDELGRLELLRGQGLTGAMSLLAKGPQGYYDHAIVVARNLFGLNTRTRDLFGDAWGGAQFVSPGEDAWNTWLAPLT